MIIGLRIPSTAAKMLITMSVTTTGFPSHVTSRRSDFNPRSNEINLTRNEISSKRAED